MTHSYSLNLSEEVLKGMTEKAFRGELQTPAPLGYTMENGRLTPMVKEAAVVKAIFELYTRENMSCGQIARHLNENSMLTKKGKLFQKRTVEYILSNPVYTGKIRWKPRNLKDSAPIIAEGKHTAIIDGETYRLAAERISKEPKKVRTAADKHILSGLLRCGRCGSAMYLCGKIFRCGGYLNRNCSYSQGVSTARLDKLLAEAGYPKADDDFIKKVDAIFYDKEKGIALSFIPNTTPAAATLETPLRES